MRRLALAQLVAWSLASGACTETTKIRTDSTTWLAGRWVLTDTVHADYGYSGDPSQPGGGPLLFQSLDTRTLTLDATRLGADSLAVTGTVTARREVDCSNTLYSYVQQGRANELQ